MVQLKEMAESYEPPQTLNIVELDEVPLTVEIFGATKKNSDGEEFTYQYARIDNKEYRVPNSVLEEIQKILKLKPSVTKINVTKTGTGLATRYQVNPLD